MAPGGALVEHIDEHGADGKALIGVEDAVEGLPEQPRAEAALGVSLVTSKTGHERGADLVEPVQVG